MRSAVPKHFHPLLGRRMVDWVLAAAVAVGADPLVVVCSPADAATTSTAYEVAVQEVPRGTGDAVRAARAALAGLRRARARPLRRRPGAPHRRAARRAARDAPRERGGGDRARVRARRRPRATAALVRGDRRSARCGSSRRATRPPTSSRSARSNSAIYVFRAESLWPALERLEPHNAQGELYLTDTIGLLVEDGETVAVHSRADPFEVEGVNTRAELARCSRRVLRDRINRAHMLAGVTIVDPATTWIEPDVEIEADVTIHPFVSPARARPASRAGAESSTRTRSRSTPRSAPARPWVRSVTFAPERSSRRIRRRVPSWRSRTHASDRARRCLTSRTSATPRSARTRTSAPARSPRTSRTSPGQPKGEDADRQERQDRDPEWLHRPCRGGRRSMDSCRIDDHRRTSPPTRSRLRARGRRTRRAMPLGSRDD